ncbi:hypothetical protein JXA12_02340 [Candidatus Woesearchaeota archaeon]|nr:hypothetical protein [Candidatus Woesearchaeota archaeon]
MAQPPGKTREQGWTTALLIALFIAVAALRIILAYQSPHPDYEAYGMLRRVEHVQETGKPLLHDNLGFGGRDQVFSPLYDYLLAALGLILPAGWLVKVVPNLFAASMVFPAYALAKYMLKRRGLSLITAGMAALVPSVLGNGINDASSLPLSMTLLVAAMYLFLKSRKSGKHLNYLLIVLVASSLLSPISIVFLVALLIYLGLLKLQQVRVAPKEIEILFFLLFFDAWFYLVVYKRAFAAHGAAVIWQNIPAAELMSVFSRITLLQALSSVGIVTLVLGVFALYAAMTQTRKKSLALLSGTLIAVLLLLWFRLVALETGLALLGLILALASGYALSLLVDYLQQTKAARGAWWAVAGIAILFIATALPTIATADLTDAPSTNDLKVLSWAKEFTDEDAVILASPKEGAVVAAVAQRRTVADQYYLLVPRMDERYEDIRSTYAAFFITDAVSKMQKYGATHLLVSSQTAAFSGVEQPAFLKEGDKCFELITEAGPPGEETKLYERRCSIREVS